MAEQTIGDLFSAEEIFEATKRWHNQAYEETLADIGKYGIEELERLGQTPLERFAASAAKEPATPENIQRHKDLMAGPPVG